MLDRYNGRKAIARVEKPADLGVADSSRRRIPAVAFHKSVKKQGGAFICFHPAARRFPIVCHVAESLKRGGE